MNSSTLHQNNNFNNHHHSLNYQQLSKAFQTILNSLYYLYLSYSIYFQILAFIFLAYISFTIGKISIHQPIDKKLKQLLKLIKYRKYLYQTLPNVQNKLSKIKKITITLILILSIALGTAFFLELLPKQYEKQIWIFLIASTVITFLFIYTYQFILNNKQSQKRKYDNLINQKTTEFIQFLGKKAQLMIKNVVSKQTIEKNKRPISTICMKMDCKKQRDYYKERHESIKYFIESVLGFEWCSTCKKRKPFDQMLAFQPHAFKGQNENQQQEVKGRIQFLLQGLGQMFNWINTIGPCNCSKLYWALSTKQIRKYKIIQKQINEGLQKMGKISK